MADESRIDPAEIARRARLVREATEAAWARGYVAPSDEDLTAALGDTIGMAPRLAPSRRKRSARPGQGRMPRSG